MCPEITVSVAITSQFVLNDTTCLSKNHTVRCKYVRFLSVHLTSLNGGDGVEDMDKHRGNTAGDTQWLLRPRNRVKTLSCGQKPGRGAQNRL